MGLGYRPAVRGLKAPPRPAQTGALLWRGGLAPGIIPTGVGKGRSNESVSVRSTRGSSPQAWGKVGVGEGPSPAPGIIPTGVEKGRFARLVRRCLQDHPHRRGERVLDEPAWFAAWGSSPQAWGKGQRTEERDVASGIIPTGVGKGPRSRSRRRPSTDHPHRRGERDGNPLTIGRGVGSSPQAWGKAPTCRGGGPACRIIPTGVGKGSAVRSGSSAPRDHPHRRGERTWTVRPVSPAGGSSPQAWGKDAPRAREAHQGGIIPTGVGKGGVPGGRRSRRRDHPHRRGERSFASRLVCPAMGSSPQAWGKERGREHLDLVRGIIPTGVGKGVVVAPSLVLIRDHPHRRGERPPSWAAIWAGVGSSPQAWGKGDGEPGEGEAGGIIPTGVGKGVSLGKAKQAGSSPQAWGKG